MQCVQEADIFEDEKGDTLFNMVWTVIAQGEMVSN